jgi:hypothetical protein
MPEIPDRINPSVSNCLTIRVRPAPIDSLIVSSCWRANARTSSRLATLAHATNSTATTTTSAMTSVGCSTLAPLNGVCQSGHNRMPRPRLVSG